MLCPFEKNNNAVVSYISMQHQVSIIVDSRTIII